MSKNTIVLLLSLWIALVPFLGFPGAWKTFFIVISALGIGYISFRVMLKRRARLSDASSNGFQANEPRQTEKQS